MRYASSETNGSMRQQSIGNGNRSSIIKQYTKSQMNLALPQVHTCRPTACIYNEQNVQAYDFSLYSRNGQLHELRESHIRRELMEELCFYLVS